MSIYILKDKTYEVFPHTSESEEEPSLTQEHLANIAKNLTEHFGCFMLFGMSLKGEPQVLMMSSSGMEQLALKQFAQDVIYNESGIDFAPLGGDGEGEFLGDSNG